MAEDKTNLWYAAPEMIDNNRIKRNKIEEIIIIKKKEKDLLQTYAAWFNGDNLSSV